MQIQFGVAAKCHFAGASAKDLLPKRFDTYDEADQYAEAYRDDCEPTIYLILNEKYAFYCARSAVENIPYMIYDVTPFKGGQIETRVWWEAFQRNPEKYIGLGHKIPVVNKT